jgi:hypothetical protein
MIVQILNQWPRADLRWLSQYLSFEFVVVLTVLEFFADSPADQNAPFLWIYDDRIMT